MLPTTDHDTLTDPDILTDSDSPAAPGDQGQLATAALRVRAEAAARPASAVHDGAIEPADEEISHPLSGQAPASNAAPTFADLQVDPRIVQALEEAGITNTFAIQALTLPIALAGHDLIGQARTGMGKTLGFGAPLLHRLAAQDADAAAAGDTVRPAGRAPRALIMVPTRELCVQVTRDLHDAARYLGQKVTSVYGGRAYEPQIAALQAGVDVVVGTPGRLLDLAKSNNLVLGAVQTLVLDEADEMLDLGFLPDIERVLGLVPDRRQTMLFSATMPGPIITLARTFMTTPTHIRAELPSESQIHRTTRQVVYRAHALDKVEMLARVLQAEGRGLTMVFTRTKRTAAKVAEELSDRGFAAAAVHGDLGQGAREQALRAFRSGKVGVLVATDVAARGIDVEGVTHVVNFQCPEDEKTYIHRIGRTGRAGHSGVAISFIDWDDLPRWQLINQALDLGFDEPVETYSTSPHLYADLNIPQDATGTLPRAKRVRAGLSAERVEDLGETGHGRRGRDDPGKHRHGGRKDGKHDGGSGDKAGHKHKKSHEGDAAPAAGLQHEGRAAPGAGLQHEDGAREQGGSDASAATSPRHRSARSRRRTRGGKPATGGESGQ